MMIDTGILRALGVGDNTSESYAPLLAEACPLWQIDVARKLAAFLATCVHESGRFATLEENLNYSAQGLANTWKRFSATGVRRGPPNELAKRIQRNPQAIANAAYANRMGNGDAASGDGWRYRGRGLIQLTGRETYAAFAATTYFDVITDPSLLMQPDCAAVSACWYWQTHGCNELAQAERWADIRQAVNGGDIGLDEVNALRETALNYFGAQQ